MNLNIKLVIRCLAAVSYTVIIGHQYETFEKVFGFSIVTLFTIITLLVFYLFAFICQFTDLDETFPPHITAKCTHQCHKVQWFLIGLNLVLAIVEFMSELHDLTLVKVITLVVQTVFIAFPDYFLGLIAKLFEKEDKDDDGKPKDNKEEAE